VTETAAGPDDGGPVLRGGQRSGRCLWGGYANSQETDCQPAPTQLTDLGKQAEQPFKRPFTMFTDCHYLAAGFSGARPERVLGVLLSHTVPTPPVIPAGLLRLSPNPGSP
jgi:hypothetical protein